MRDDRHGVRRRRIEHGERIADIGIPAVERCVVRIAVATMVPGDDAPASGGEQRCEDIERAREVRATMDEKERRGLFVAPLANGQADAEGADPTMPVRPDGTGK